LPSTLSCEIVEYPEPFVVKLSGEIDVANYEQVAALAQHPGNGHGTVIFDVADITFFGSSGIAAFVLVAASAQRFVCRDPSSFVTRVLEITGLDEWLEAAS
jgi:anti-anti-sigma factor